MWTAPRLQEKPAAVLDRIACNHMSGLSLRSLVTTGQDGFRDKRSKQGTDVCRHWIPRSVSRLGSIDPTISSFSHKLRQRQGLRLADLYAASARPALWLRLAL